MLVLMGNSPEVGQLEVRFTHIDHVQPASLDDPDAHKQPLEPRYLHAAASGRECRNRFTFLMVNFSNANGSRALRQPRWLALARNLSYHTFGHNLNGTACTKVPIA